jgi:signal transduction histidine kinase
LRADLQDDAMLSVYRNELMQVVLNVLKNSEDNFKEKNTQEKYIEIRTYEENGIHTIALADNGGGIPHEIMSKIFDPYFSTKYERNGTGLGLYMSKIIIEEHHNGELIAENTSEGVCFTIRLCSNVG